MGQNQQANLRTALHVALTGLIGIYAVGSIIIGLYFYVFPPDNAVSAFLLSGYIMALLPTLVMAVLVALLMKRWWLIPLLLSILLILLMYMMPYFAPKPETIVTDGIPIRVMTYNVESKSHYPVRDIFADLIDEVNPDIMAFQEFREDGYNFWRNEGRLTDYAYIARVMSDNGGLSGQAIYSRFPILDAEDIRYDDLSPFHPHQRLVLDVNGRQIVVYNIHPYPPIEWEGLVIATNEDDLSAHSIAMARLLFRMEVETSPVIVIGDMNMTDRFPEYRALSTLYTDSFMEAGSGFGFTYPADSILPEIFRLDFIFHSLHFIAVDAFVLPDNWTADHLPLVADLILSN